MIKQDTVSRYSLNACPLMQTTNVTLNLHVEPSGNQLAMANPPFRTETSRK